MKIDAKEALRMALIDAIESRSALAAGDPDNRDMHRAYLDAYRKLLKRRTGSNEHPVDAKLKNAQLVTVWPPRNSWPKT